MNVKIGILGFGLTLFLLACAAKTYQKENTAFIVLKTPTFKYADMGFIYENKEDMKIEIYSTGQVLMSLIITEDSVCMSALECMSKEQFNQSVLSQHYPKDIMAHIFRGKSILEGEGFKKKGNGFTQKIIKQDKYNIEYSVLNKQIIFRDTMNTIIIKVKKY